LYTQRLPNPRDTVLLHGSPFNWAVRKHIRENMTGTELHVYPFSPNNLLTVIAITVTKAVKIETTKTTPQL